MSEHVCDTACSEEQVRDYLRQHKDFFERHGDLLEELNLPHARGDAVSLIERQVSLLRERNIDMRRRLGRLLDSARDNDRLFASTRRLVLKLLETDDLESALNTVLASFSDDFKIPYVSLILFAEHSDLRRSGAHLRSLQEARSSLGRILSSNKIVCGNFGRDELDFLFPEQAEEVGSAAVMPLIETRCFGLIAIGNKDPDYYRSSMGTIFLSYIGEVLNRLLPKHLS